MRKLVIAVAVIVVLIVVVLLVIPLFLDVNQYRGEIQSQLQQRLNRPVQLGQLSLHLIPVRITAQNVVIGDDPNFHSNVPFAQVAELDVSVKLLPLLHKDVEIESLNLKRPQIELIHNAKGVWNFSTIAESPSSAPANAPVNNPPQTNKPSQPSGGGAPQISLGELKITDGQIAVTDQQKRQPRSVYDHIDITLKNFAPGEPFSLALAAHLPGNGSQQISLTADGGPINNADASKTPLKGTLKLDQVSLAGVQKFLNSSSLEGTDANVSGSVDLNSANGVMAADGALKMTDVVVHGTKVGYPITTDFSVNNNLAGDVLDIKKFDAHVGSTSLSAQGRMTQTNSPSPNVDATVSCPNAKVDELLSLAQVFGVSAADGMKGSGNISLNVHATGPVSNSGAMKLNGSGSLNNVALQPAGFTQPVHIKTANIQFAENAMNLSNLAASLGSSNATGNASVANFQAPHLTFALNIDKVNVTELQQITGGSSAQPAKKRASADWRLVPSAEAAPAAQPSMMDTATGNGTLAVGNITYQQTVLTNVRSNVALNRGVVQLNPLTSNIFGGQQSGSITIDTRPNPMTYQANIKLANVDANQMLSATSSVKNTVYGTLGATTNISFATPPSGDVTPTLNGTMALNLANGKIMKLDLPSELAKIGKFGGGASKGYTAISQMSGTFNVRQGVAQTNDLKAALDIGTMAANGTINLVNQSLNMHVTTALNKGFSQSVGGTGVGGYMNTALGNKNGELVIPVIITGSMDHPIVAPDMEQIAKMKLNNVLPTAGGLLSGKAGGSGVGGIVGGLLGGGQQQQPGKQGQQQQQQQNPLGGVLNGILGGKKH